MQKLDSLTIDRDGDLRTIELWKGDLTELTPEEAVDILVVSAFPGDYLPVKGTLIKALNDKGVSVDELSKDKRTDLPSGYHCWLSKEIVSTQPGIHFKHILCFEPPMIGRPAERVGQIFRSLTPFLINNPKMTSVAMPLVSTGSVGEDAIEMMNSLFDAAVGWLEKGLPLKTLKIFVFTEPKATEIKGAFSILKLRYKREDIRRSHKPTYDLFVSYSHKDSEEVKKFMDIFEHKISIKVFQDIEALKPGDAWHEKLYRSLDDARKVLVLFSKDYLASEHCLEEFNMANLLNSRKEVPVLFPVFLKDADLKSMSEIHYFDCREGDPIKIGAACEKLAEQLGVEIVKK